MTAKKTRPEADGAGIREASRLLDVASTVPDILWVAGWDTRTAVSR